MKISSVLLSDIGKFIRGITFSPDDITEQEGPEIVRCMRTKNIQESLEVKDLWKLNRSLIKNDEKYLREGDILISSANSWNLVGKACWIPKLSYESSFGGFTTVLRADQSKINPRYLYYWFISKNIQTLLRSFANKTTNISNLDLKRAYSLRVPHPPLEEQQRIVSILDSVNSILKKREKIIYIFDKFIFSKFNYLFNSINKTDSKNTKDPLHKLGNFVDILSGFAFASKYFNQEKGQKLIRIRDVKRGYSKTYYSGEFDKKYFIKQDDMLIGMDGEFNIQKWGKEEALLNQRVCKITPSKECLEKSYLYYFLNNKLKLIENSTQFTTVKHLSVKTINEILIALPPLIEQQKFSKIVKKYDLIKIKHLTSLKNNKELLNSLQHQLFEIQ